MRHVKIVNPSRTHYVGKVGVVAKTDTREGLPYLGVEFEGVEHVVWFFESEFKGIEAESVGAVRLA